MNMTRGHMIYVDSIAIHGATGGTCRRDSVWFLSHEHTDVAVPRRCVVLTSDIVSQQMGLTNVRPTFEYAQLPKWYDCASAGQVWVFPTDHCCGSIGFYFLSSRVLFLGDGRITARIKSVVDYLAFQKLPISVCYYDNLFEDQSVVSFPSIAESMGAFKGFCRMHLHTTRTLPLLVKPHSGVLEAIRKYTNLTVAPLRKTDQHRLLQIFPLSRVHHAHRAHRAHRVHRAHHVHRAHQGQSADVVVSFDKNVEMFGIRLSALYFFSNMAPVTSIHLRTVLWHREHRLFRLFISFHSSPCETRRLFHWLPAHVKYIGVTQRRAQFVERRRV